MDQEEPQVVGEPVLLLQQVDSEVQDFVQVGGPAGKQGVVHDGGQEEFADGKFALLIGRRGPDAA